MTSLLGTARLLRLVGLTPARLGREGWRETVRVEHRLMTSATSEMRPRTRFEPVITRERLRAIQERERQSASPGEIARAERLGDRLEAACPKCAGARYVAVRMTAGAPAVPMPCECMPLSERAFTAQIPGRFSAATLDTFDEREGSQEARAFGAAWDGERSVVLWGPNGTGKTRLGCALLLSRLALGRAARFVAVPDLMDELRARFRDEAESADEYLAHVSREPLLMLDDLGAEGDTPWTRERMSTLIDRRYRSQLPTIVTTNLTHREIAERYGRRLADRLYEWRWLQLAGESMRREMARA